MKGPDQLTIHKYNLIRNLYSVIYCKCPKILYTKMADKMAYANSADPDQTAPKEQPDQGLHCLPFH